MKWNRVWILAGLGSLLTGCAAQQGAQGRPPGVGQAVLVRAVASQTADVPLEVSAIGNAEAIATVDVKSRIAAPVIRVHFQEGQDVAQGQLLFELDPESILRQITENEANLARDTALEKQSRANVLKDQANLKQARNQAERGLALAKDGVFSKEQTEQVVTSADSAQASLEADQAAVESAVAAVKADQARLAENRLQLSYTRIMAPISGRAGVISSKVGSLVKENDTTLVTLLQTSPIYVSFAVPENLLPEVRAYQSRKPLLVTATAADGKTEEGTLQFIDSAVDQTTGQIKLKARFDNRRRGLWPGQFVTVLARLELERGRTVVPARTLQSGPDGKYVWVVSRGTDTVSMRNVEVLRTVGGEGTESAVIGRGLQPGELVVSEGQLRLTPGARVRILGAPPQAASQRTDNT